LFHELTKIALGPSRIKVREDPYLRFLGRNKNNVDIKKILNVSAFGCSKESCMAKKVMVSVGGEG
jgi:hypothetical protein